MNKDELSKLSDVGLVGEIWRKRLEFLWLQCEFSGGKPLEQRDINWIDSQIDGQS